jgi:hypothetical protein
LSSATCVDRAAGRIDVRAIEIRDDGDRAPGAAGCLVGTRRNASLARRRAARHAPVGGGAGGKSAGRRGFAGVDARRVGGRESFCHASHSRAPENEKTTNR